MSELRITATRENLDRVNACLEEELERLECPPRPAMQLQLALEELYVNIASYAYAPEEGEALIRIEFDEADGMVTVILADWGKPFDPLDRTEPDVTLSAEERGIGGLGIFMVKKSMDVFSYERRDGMNIVTIGKKIRK